MTLRGTQLSRIELGGDGFPIQKGSGPFFAVNLSSLEIASYADDSTDFFRNSPVELLENGVPLRNHTDYSTLIAGTPGSFTHWSQWLYFTPTEGEPEGKTYTLLYPQLKIPLSRSARELNGVIWPLLLIISLVAALSLKAFRVPLDSPQIKLLFLLPVAVFFSYQFYFGTIKGWWNPIRWETFSCAPDSAGWIEPYSPQGTRPPVYPTLINTLIPAVDKSMCSAVPINTLISNRPDLPLLKLIHAQKLLLLTSVFVAAWFLMNLIPAPLIAFLLEWICGNGYLPAEMDTVLAETVAQSWMYLIAAAFALYLLKPKTRTLVLLAALCGLLFQTRTAGVFSFVIFGFAVLYCFFQQPQNRLAAIAASVCLLAAIFLAPMVQRFLSTGFVTSAPMYADARIPFALEFATPQDMELMPDEISRRFLEAALKKKAEVDSGIPQTNPPTKTLYLGTNLYRVAHPTADQLGLQGTDRRDIFLKVAEPILSRHRWQHIQLMKASLLSGVEGICRFNQPPFPGVWLFFGLILVLSIVSWSKESWFALGLTAAHWAHMTIAAAFDLPSPRNFHASEFLVLLAFAAVATGAARRAGRLSAAAIRRRPGAAVK